MGGDLGLISLGQMNELTVCDDDRGVRGVLFPDVKFAALNRLPCSEYGKDARQGAPAVVQVTVLPEPGSTSTAESPRSPSRSCAWPGRSA